MLQNNLSDGIYFLHISFLKEASKGLNADGVSDQLQFLMNLVFNCDTMQIKLISCDRTMSEIAKSKYSIGFTPGILSIIEEKSHHDGEIEDDDYAFKIASREKISQHPNFFIVSEDVKETLSEKASTEGYKFKILSVEDFKN